MNYILGIKRKYLKKTQDLDQLFVLKNCVLKKLNDA